MAAPISMEEPREGECIVILLPMTVGCVSLGLAEWFGGVVWCGWRERKGNGGWAGCCLYGWVLTLHYVVAVGDEAERDCC